MTMLHDCRKQKCFATIACPASPAGHLVFSVIEASWMEFQVVSRNRQPTGYVFVDFYCVDSVGGLKIANAMSLIQIRGSSGTSTSFGEPSTSRSLGCSLSHT